MYNKLIILFYFILILLESPTHEPSSLLNTRWTNPTQEPFPFEFKLDQSTLEENTQIHTLPFYIYIQITVGI